MRVVTSPVALPGSCFICGSGVRQSYIDTEITIDLHGACYVCNLCVHEFAQMYGYLSNDEYKDLRKAKEDLERLSYEAIKRLGILEESLRALASVGYGDGNVVDYPASISSIVEDSTENPLNGTKHMGTGERETPESLYDEGVEHVSSNESQSNPGYKFDF